MILLVPQLLIHMAESYCNLFFTDFLVCKREAKMLVQCMAPQGEMLLQCRMSWLCSGPVITQAAETNRAEPREPVGHPELVSEPRAVPCPGLPRTFCFHFSFQHPAVECMFVLGWHWCSVKRGWKKILIAIPCMHLAQTSALLKCTSHQ